MSIQRIMMGVLVFAASTVLGQSPRGGESTSSGELRLNGFSFGNLFQAPVGSPEEDVTALQVEGRFEWRWKPAGSWRLLGKASATDYDSGLDPSQAVAVGVEREGRHGVELELEYANDRPSVETDVFDQADVARFSGRYTLRPVREWQFSIVGIVETQSYERASGRDNDFRSFGGAVRYRGFGRLFSPEIGASLGERTVDTSAGTHDQEEYWLRVVSAPAEPLYLSVRYRLRRREYTTVDPSVSNFGREDDREQWAVTGAWRFTDRWALNLYWARESSDSTREGVDFRTSVAVLGLAWSFD